MMIFDQKLVSIIGLTFDLAGAVLRAWGLFVSKKKALELGVSYWCGDTDEENLKLPPVQNLLRQSCNAKIGVLLLAVGFLLQIIGNLIS